MNPLRFQRTQLVRDVGPARRRVMPWEVWVLLVLWIPSIPMYALASHDSHSLKKSVLASWTLHHLS